MNFDISGNVTFSGSQEKTIMLNEKIIISGNFTSKFANFENLKIKGNSELEFSNITQIGDFYGNAKFVNCQFNQLNLRGRNFLFKNSTINEDINFRESKGKIVLFNDGKVLGKINKTKN